MAFVDNESLRFPKSNFEILAPRPPSNDQCNHEMYCKGSNVIPQDLVDSQDLEGAPPVGHCEFQCKAPEEIDK